GVLRVNLLDALQVEQLAQAGGDFGQVLSDGDIVEVEGADDLFFVVAALLSVVRRDEDDVFCDRLPEGLAFERNDIEGLLEGDVIQIDGDTAGLEVGIVNDGDTGELADSVVNDLEVVGHAQIDGRTGEGLELGGLRGQGGLAVFHQRRLVALGG